MKLASCFIFCAILTLQYYSADGYPKGLLEDLCNSVKDTAHKVRTDVGNLFHPKKSEKESEDNVAATNEQTADDSKNSDTGLNQDVKPVEVTTQSATTTTAAGAPKSETVTEKDGRENFSGACLPGYLRTADGRCKPSF